MSNSNGPGWDTATRYYVWDKDAKKPVYWGDYPPPCSPTVRIGYWELAGVVVQTTFTGLDKGFGGIPILWETVVSGMTDVELSRPWLYDAHEEAVTGHLARVEQILQAMQAQGLVPCDMVGPPDDDAPEYSLCSGCELVVEDSLATYCCRCCAPVCEQCLVQVDGCSGYCPECG